MSEFRTAVFNKKVNKIAVCFYGQYRTGTYCLPIIEKFLSQIDADVDVFCSLKNYTTYATRHSYTKNNGIDGHPSNWNDIAEMLLGAGATEKDTLTVESMIAFLKGKPGYEELVAPFKDALEKAGKSLPESVYTVVGTTDWFSKLSERLK